MAKERKALWLEVELVMQYYQPDKISPNTLFMNIHYPGTDREFVSVYPLGSATMDLFEKGMVIPDDFGQPVQPHLLDFDKRWTVTSPDEFGWFDHPDHEEYQPFTYKEMNIILDHFDGICEILIDEENYENDFIQPLYVDDKVVIRGSQPEEEDELDE